MKLIPICEGMVRVEHDADNGGPSSPSIGIQLSPYGDRTMIATLGQKYTMPWYMVHGHDITLWHPSGTFISDNRLYLQGPLIAGLPLSHLMAQKEANLLSKIAQLAHAFTIMEQASWKYIPALSTHYTIFLDDGGILCAPAPLHTYISSYHQEEEQFHDVDSISHPEYSHDTADDAQKKYGFALAALTYYAVTSHFPFPQKANISETREHIRYGAGMHVRHHVPSVKPNLAYAIDAMLFDHIPRPLVEWERLITSCVKEGTRSRIEEPQEQQEQIIRQEKRSYTRTMRRFRTQRFLKTNWKVIVGTTIAVICIGSIPITILGNILRPSPIEGLSPLEVVEVFYSAFNDLDHILIEEIFARGTDHHYRDEVGNIFVIYRARQALEGQSFIRNPNEWRNSRQAELEDIVVYGIENIELSIEDEDTDTVYIEADYIKWRPILSEAERAFTVGRHTVIFRQMERVELRLIKEIWHIASIELLNMEQLFNIPAVVQ